MLVSQYNSYEVTSLASSVGGSQVNVISFAPIFPVLKLDGSPGPKNYKTVILKHFWCNIETIRG